MKQEPLISIRGLTKSFGQIQVLQGIDLDILKGESLVIIGGSGSGKSVMLRCLLGLLDVNSGDVTIDGIDMVNDSDERISLIHHQMGMLFQSAALFDSLNVWENIAFKAIERGTSKKEAFELARVKLNSVGLDDTVLNKFPSELSGGMKKRVSLARTICDNPSIIFFDEPTTGLDPITANVINNLIVNVVKDIGATAITITHNIESARKIADRVAMLYEGKIIWTDHVDKLDHNNNSYVRQFINGDIKGPINAEI